MKTKEVIEFFGGTNATARALGITQPAVSQWGEDVPASRQAHIELAMKAERERRAKEAKKQAKAEKTAPKAVA